MMDRLIAWSLRHRFLVLAGAGMLLALGVRATVTMPIDVFPDLTAPTVTVIAEAHGMAPTEVESLVTFPIESALNGAAGVRRVRSATAIGIAVVWVEFEWGQDIYAARQIVSEKLALIAESLPPEVERPVLAPVSSIMGEILFVSLTSDRHDPIEVRTFAETTVRRRLLGIPGVSQVTPIGGGEKQYQVILDPLALRQHRVSLAEVENAIEESNENSSAGFLVAGGSEYLVEARGRVRTTEEIGATVVDVRRGRPIRLRDLGEIRVGEALKRGTASAQGKPAVVLGIQKQPGANTIALTKEVEKALDEIERTMPAGYVIGRGIFRQADFIEVSIRNVSHALRDGTILVIVIVLLFLGNLRATGITLIALPLSLATAILALQAMGATINTMTLGGFAMAIGALVDDAIIAVENIVRRLREEAKRPEGERKHPLKIAYDASREIRGSIVFATIIIALVFLPIFVLSGVEGRLLVPLGFAYVIAILASLIVALTVTPVLCLLLLPRTKQILTGHEPRLVGGLKRMYGGMLRWTLSHPTAVVGLSVGILVPALWGGFAAGRSFLPEFNEGSLTISAVTLPGTSLAESDRLGLLVEKILLEQPEVTKVARRTGRAELDEHVQGVEAAELDVSLAIGEGRSKEELLGDLREKLSVVPGMNIVIGQPISHRIDHMLSGTRANIAVKVFGEDLVKLRAVGEEVRKIMSRVPGVVDLAAEPQLEIPFLRIHLDRDAVARYGLQVGEIAETIETVMVGKPLSRVLEGRNAFDLVMRFPDKVRADFDAIGDIPIDTPTGGRVPLRSLARIAKEKGPNAISREDVQRKYVLMANVSGRDLKGVVDEIDTRVKASGAVPEGYHVVYGGQFESAASAGRTLSYLGIGVVAGIFFLLFAALGTVRDAILVMVNLPLALVGGVAGVWLTGGVISIAHVIGFITLFGIATRNGLMLLSHVKHIREIEGEQDFRAAIERGALERLAPILMTALAAGLALIPLAMGGGKPGNEIQTPMAIVILAGLLSSTFLNMIVVPALYLRYGPKELEKKHEEEVDFDLAGRSPHVGAAAVGGFLVAATAGLALAGCATERPTTEASRPSPDAARSAPPAPPSWPSGPIDLGTAERLALERHPSLESYAALSEAAEGRRQQAGTLPNPRLELASESNLWDDPRRTGEHVAGVSYPIPWGGRVGAAERAEALRVDRRIAELLAKKREVLEGVRTAFAAALAADMGVEVSREIAEAARASADFVRKRFAAGQAKEGDRLRVEVEESRADLDVESARLERTKALAELAAALGDPDARIDGVTGALAVAAPPAREGLDLRLNAHPRLLALAHAAEAARADVERARAERIPDLTFGGRYRKLDEEEEDAFDVYAAIDLPLFDRKAGAIREAEHFARSADAERRAELAALRRALDAALADLERSSHRAQVLEAEVLPKAVRTLEIADGAYQAGATTILDLLEARRTLAQTRLSLVEAQRGAAQASARAEALIGE